MRPSSRSVHVVVRWGDVVLQVAEVPPGSSFYVEEVCLVRNRPTGVCVLVPEGATGLGRRSGEDPCWKPMLGSGEIELSGSTAVRLKIGPLDYEIEPDAAPPPCGW